MIRKTKLLWHNWPCVAALLATGLLAQPAQAAYTFNADGTVNDTTTGLMWDRCVWGRTGPTCGGGSPTLTDWPGALRAATTANTALHKGYSDWRLPNVKELESLVNITTSNPAIDAMAFPNTPVSGDWWGEGGHWTSTTYAPFPAYAWVVNFFNGYTLAIDTTGSYYVRLVRSGQSLAAFDSLPTRDAAGPTATGTGTLSTHVAGGNAGCGFASTQWRSVAAVAPAAPAGVTFPHGLLAFATNNCGAGAALTFTVNLPTAVAAGTPYYKYGKTAADPTNHWYTLPATLNPAGTQYTFTITDGGLGDDDLTVNGVITDDGGPGVPDPLAAARGIPTLGEWALLALGSLLLLLGARRLPVRAGVRRG